MPDDNPSGDTYGPLNYLAYVPAVKVFPQTDWGNSMPAANAVTIGAT